MLEPTRIKILEKKLKNNFGEEVVNKAFSNTPETSRLPRFIAEYAIKKICGDTPNIKDL